MPTDVLTLIPSKDSSISIVNFLINFFLTSRFILLYNTDALIPSFFESMGTEIFPFLVNSNRIFISSSSNLSNDEKPSHYLINIDFINIVHANFNQYNEKQKIIYGIRVLNLSSLNDFK